MKKISSFQIDHTRLLEGLYVSRTDVFGKETFTTFDLRFVRPNSDDILSTKAVHAIEHLAASYFRNHKTVYFGPMGCRTGFYLIVHGKLSSLDILSYVEDMLKFIIDFEGVIPGQSEKECGNYKDMSLREAKTASKKYLALLMENNDKRFEYA